MPTESSGTIAWLAARLTLVPALNSMVGVGGSPASDSALMFSWLAGWLAGWLGWCGVGTLVGHAVLPLMWRWSGGWLRRRGDVADVWPRAPLAPRTRSWQPWAGHGRASPDWKDECNHHGGPRLYNVEPVGPVGLL